MIESRFEGRRKPQNNNCWYRRKGRAGIFTLAKMEDQMGSTSWTLAAVKRVWILSAYSMQTKSAAVESKLVMHIQCFPAISQAIDCLAGESFAHLEYLDQRVNVR